MASNFKKNKKGYPSKKEIQKFYDRFLDELKSDEQGNPRHEFIKESLNLLLNRG